MAEEHAAADGEEPRGKRAPFVTAFVNEHGFHPLPLLSVGATIVLFLLFKVSLFLGAGGEVTDGLAWESPRDSIEIATRELAARLYWSATVYGQVIAMGTVLVACVVALLGLPIELARRIVAIAVAFTLLVAIVVLIAYFIFPISFAPPVADAILHEARARCGIGFVDWATTAFNLAAVFIVALVTLIVCALVAIDSQSLLIVERVKRRGKELRALLYASSFLIVVGLLQINAQYRWPASLLSADDPDSSHVTRLAAGITVAAGTFFTFMLIAVHGSATWIMYRHALKCVPPEHGLTKRKRTRWLIKNDVLSSEFQYFKELLALFAPFALSGALVELVALVLE